MKYFKYEYWIGMQSSESTDDIDRLWMSGEAEYLKQLENLESKLSGRNYRFFRYDGLHDGYITDLIVTTEIQSE
ncbi:hypothetical protein QWJ34_12495 [Saccharibacillus sp. CPCC 101409]|nr:hypothetical protein [Saccharibacillus sp. CPCC 101409]